MSRVGFYDVDAAAAARANGRWWSENAGEYIDEHGAFLGDADFRWCPEGLREEDARLLGDVEGRRVLEVGAGAGQCSRWLAGRGADVLATDIAPGMVAQSAELDRRTGWRVPAVVADARALPLADDSFDVAFTAFGAIPFVPDAQRVHAEVARVLRPGGRWVFAVVHPVRWIFPDDPSPEGMRVLRSYFDRTPYVETDDAGAPLYAEYHRTFGDHVREVAAAGLVIDDVVEPEWQEGNLQVWGGWGPHRGRYVPGTAIFVTHLPR
ncbi:class I SAM-dependent methyltransferase [Georgenia sp. 311]|uniref:class I SAM-dependent methyltransferase n=1 Tax=Georgenia sp. 311 TaxID=2585134 RepID=UPI001111F1B4|nr:class I SAM-dependent methyltransferase [Georgenia sp. 311]TNC17408.1 class I SAM-dependent methyltransferase [Georgenia sp. 311]